jgi:hypothetical protein
MPSDEVKKQYIYTSFVTGRVPGQSEKKALYDYVSEFGENALPAEKVAEYREGLWTLNRIVSYPFEKGTIAAKGAVEWSDWAFDKLKDKPGAWGTLGDIMHTAYNKGLIELNPWTSSAFPYAITYSHQAAGTLLDVLNDTLQVQPTDVLATYSGGAPGLVTQAAGMHDKTSDISEVWSGYKHLVAAHQWVESWQAHAGKDAFVDLGDDYADQMGIPEDSWARTVSRDLLTVTSQRRATWSSARASSVERRPVLREHGLPTRRSGTGPSGCAAKVAS